MNPKSSIKDRNVTEGLVLETLLKTPLIYIRKRIRETGEPYRIPISTSLFSLACLSITSCTFRFVKNKLVPVKRSLSISSSIIHVKSYFFKTWLNTPLTSIKSVVASFFSSHLSCTIWTYVATTSIANLSLSPPIYPRCSLEYFMQ